MPPCPPGMLAPVRPADDRLSAWNPSVARISQALLGARVHHADTSAAHLQLLPHILVLGGVAVHLRRGVGWGGGEGCGCGWVWAGGGEWVGGCIGRNIGRLRVPEKPAGAPEDRRGAPQPCRDHEER